jgi:hypothetical protein
LVRQRKKAGEVGRRGTAFFLALASASHCCGYLHLAHGMPGLRAVVHVLMENSAMQRLKRFSAFFLAVLLMRLK